MKQKKRQPTSRYVLVLSILVVLLAACAPQTLQRVIVTPTPPQNIAVLEAARPTDTQQPLTAVAAVATTVVSPTPTQTQAIASPTQPTPLSSPALGQGDQVGPIIDEDYVPPPTSTPVPTDTPAPTFSPTPALPPLDRELMGIQVYANVGIQDFYYTMEFTKPLDLGWVKFQVDWSNLQPDGPEQFDAAFSLFEDHVVRAKLAGHRVLLSVAKAPGWARSTDVEAGPPDDPNTLANFLRFMLNRTKVGAHVDAVEVWNEPNLQREWQGTLPFDGQGYMQLFRPVYDAIQETHPQLAVITAGLAPTSTMPGSVDDRDFLQQMYDAGLAQYGDRVAVGVHPYGWGNPPDARCCQPGPERGWDENRHFYFIHNLEEPREIMMRNGHTDAQMWVTEFGWATWEGFDSPRPVDQGWMDYVTPLLQAEYTSRAFEIGQGLDYVGPMILWNLNFANSALIERSDEKAGFSLLLPNRDGLPLQRPFYQYLAAS